MGRTRVGSARRIDEETELRREPCEYRSAAHDFAPRTGGDTRACMPCRRALRGGGRRRHLSSAGNGRRAPPARGPALPLRRISPSVRGLYAPTTPNGSAVAPPQPDRFHWTRSADSTPRFPPAHAWPRRIVEPGRRFLRIERRLRRRLAPGLEDSVRLHPRTPGPEPTQPPPAALRPARPDRGFGVWFPAPLECSGTAERPSQRSFPHDISTLLRTRPGLDGRARAVFSVRRTGWAIGE